MNRKILVTLAVLAVVLAVVAVAIEAHRGGGSRGGMGGGRGGMSGMGGGIAPIGNYDAPSGGCGNYNGNFPLYNGNYGNGNYDAIEVCVSTDKRRYVLDEPIHITVTAHNLADSTVTVVFPEPCREIPSYIVDGYITRYDYVDENGTLVSGTACGTYGDATYTFQPDETISRSYSRTTVIGDIGFGYVGYYPALPVGRHSVVGTIGIYNPPYESDPLTIWVTEPYN